MGYPKQVQVVEVGPRDGFQSIKTWIPTETKIKIITALLKADLIRIEVTSFVNPKAIPQMKDAALVAGAFQACAGTDLMALAPNLHGAKAAYTAGIKKVTYVISASERHNIENVRMTILDSFAELKRLKKELPKLRIKLAVATAFGCPFQGLVTTAQVINIIEYGLSVPVDEICLCDTTGGADPLQMETVLDGIKKHFGSLDISLHLHDTRGMGLANVIVAMQRGINVFETAIGGVGGCPFTPGAAGNIATEDLVNMLQQMGIKTNVNLSQILEAVKIVKSEISPNLTGHMANVCQIS